MLPAFVLGTFGLWSVIDFGLSHILTLGSVGIAGAIVACVLLAIFVPGSIALIRTAIGVLMKGLTWLISTTIGAFIITAFICLIVGWEGRAFLDRSMTLRQQLAAQAQETAAARAAAVVAQLQAAALRDLNDAAAKRAEAAESQSEDLQEQVTDYAAQLAAADKASTPKTPARSYALTAADVAALTHIGAARAKP